MIRPKVPCSAFPVCRIFRFRLVRRKEKLDRRSRGFASTAANLEDIKKILKFPILTQTKHFKPFNVRRILKVTIIIWNIRSALVIRGFAIHGFNYSRTRKQGKIANNEEKITVLAWFMHMSQAFAEIRHFRKCLGICRNFGIFVVN